MPGGRLFLFGVQDVRAGGRQSNAEYQYTLQSDDADELFKWTQRLVNELEHSQIMADVSSDQQQRGLESDLVIDRDTASRLGITPAQIDNTLYDAFGQRQVSVIYSAINQYHVVMEIDPRNTQYPASLGEIYVATSGGGAAGTQDVNAPARYGHGGQELRKIEASDERSRSNRQQQFGAQCLHQCSRQYRQRLDLFRRGGIDRAGNHDPAVCDESL